MGELSETNTPTKSRRRRWWIVPFVLLILSVAWWNWPRRDARFVGKWRANVAHFTWNLHANGTATLESRSPPTAADPMFHTTWNSQGNVLTIGRSPYAPRRPNWQDRLIALLARYVPSHQILNKGYCLEMKVIEPGRLEGIDATWPDDPTPPDVIQWKHIIWWDDFDGEMKMEDIQYKFRKGEVPSAMDRIAREQSQIPDAERKSRRSERLRKLEEKDRSRE